MKILADFLPIFLFFIAYKLAGIYVATTVAITAAGVQIVYTWVRNQKVEAIHLITFSAILMLGGATLYFHNEWFVKWKPTVVNWIFAFVFMVTQYLKKPLIQTLLGQKIEAPDGVWSRLNWAWVGFFIVVGSLNLWVAYCFSTDTWVNFKLFGILGLTVAFVLLQAFILAKYQLDQTKP